MTEESELPEWWLENQKYKSRFNLPKYEPPKFEDGVFVHKVISCLENQYNCDILFINKEGEIEYHPPTGVYRENWEVRVDGQKEFIIPRYRDNNGNIIYMISSKNFKEKFFSELEIDN